MNHLLRILVVVFLIPVLGFAQTDHRNCGAMDHLKLQIDKDPVLSERMQQIENFTARYLEEHKNQASLRQVITIPVVVHVVYRSSSQNVSDSQIQSQLDVLNEDFRRTNADRTNQWSQAADTEFEFCLATTDPSGNPTSGIQRRSTKKRSFSYSNDGVKFNSSGGIDAWPAGDYMNLWVCNLGNNLLGYAQFPGGADNTDGVVIDYAYFGRGGSAQAPFNLGRTGTHEVGHWLNLRHIWGDGGCSVDDFISDTPQSDAPNYGCATGHVSCSTTDMVENYMDYSDDACMNLFTNGQKSRMMALFASGGARESLLNSNGCGGGTAPTCSDGIQNGDETGVDCGGSCPNDCPVVTCTTPTGLFASSIGQKKARTNWGATLTATSYTVQYRRTGTSSWSQSTTTSTSQNLGGLARNTSYEWQVRSNCSGGSSSDWSVTCSFTTGQSNSSACGTSRQMIRELMISPNPVSANMRVRVSMEFETKLQFTVYNSVGQIVHDEVSANAIKDIQVNQLTAGIYYLRVTNEVGESMIQKFVKSN